MASKPYNTQAEREALAREYVEDWASFFGVAQQWTIHISFEKAAKMEDSESAAECNWPTAYTTARIKFNTDSWKKQNPCTCELEETAVHEVGHLVDCLIWDWAFKNLNGPFRREVTDMLERQCDVWTRIAIRARYGDDYRCGRCSELHGSDDTEPSEPVESLRGETGDSGRELRDDSTSATGSLGY